MGGKSPPDYTNVALAQGDQDMQSLTDQTYANRPDQYTPGGFVKWTQETVPDGRGGTTTRWAQTQGLTPELQEQFNKTVAINGGKIDLAGRAINQLGNQFSSNLDYRGAPPPGVVPDSQFTIPEPEVENPYGTRGRAEDAMYQQAMSRLNPRIEAEREQTEIRMRNQGLRPEDEAWQSQMRTLGENENDAVNQAIWSSVGEGRMESGQMFDQLMGRNQNSFNQALGANAQNFGQAMSGQQFANQIRQYHDAELQGRDAYGMNRINALLSGSQVNPAMMPNFSQAGQANGAPLYQAAVDAGNFKQGQNQATWGGVGDLAGAGATLFAG